MWMHSQEDLHTVRDRVGTTIENQIHYVRDDIMNVWKYLAGLLHKIIKF